MKLPAYLDRAAIRALKATDTLAIRLVLRSAPNNGAYRINAKSRTYILERDHEADAHILDIPISLWMAGDAKFTNANTSPCHDLFVTRQDGLQIIPQVVPYRKFGPSMNACPREASPEPVTTGNGFQADSAAAKRGPGRPRKQPVQA